MKFKKVILRDHDNFSISMFLSFVFSSIFNLHSSFFILRPFSHVSIPLRGNLYETVMIMEANPRTNGSWFPSPCGEICMKQTTSTSTTTIFTPPVSVPLRGNGYETPVIFKPYPANLSKWSIDAPHFSLNKKALLTDFQENW